LTIKYQEAGRKKKRKRWRKRKNKQGEEMTRRMQKEEGEAK